MNQDIRLKYAVSTFVSLACAIAIQSPSRLYAQSSSLPFVAPVFSSHMVLQREMQDPIWGWSTPGDTITIDVSGNSVSKHLMSTSGSDGKWMATLPILKVGGPYEVKIADPAGNSADFTDVLCGDVWLCSGQSNMQFGIGNADGGQAEIKNGSYPEIRLFCVNGTAPSTTPALTAQTVGWDIASPDSLQHDGTWNGFSAVGWYFGKEIYQDQKIPIGLLASDVGGTPIEAWTSADVLAKQFPDIASGIPDQWSKATASHQGQNNVASVLFNCMINPLIPYGIKGALWYQGESNWYNGYQYRQLLPAMIGDWRTRWNEGNFPFLIAQIAGTKGNNPDPGEDGSSNVRESEYIAAQNTPDCGIATAVDIGNGGNIHPTDKADMGMRLALVARAKVYHEKLIYSGPTYKSMSVQGSAIQIDFDNVFGGLVQMPPPDASDLAGTAQVGTPSAGIDIATAYTDINGFQIAGADQKWYWASAKIVDKYSVLVSSPSVPNPVAVRYGWSGWLPLDLYNNAALPVMPFRTDNWKLWTQP